MGFIRSLLQPTTERRQWYLPLLEMTPTTRAGVPVSIESSYTSTAVWACVRVISESVASLPLILYRRLPNGGKERATDHPLYRILHDAPNDEMTSYDFRETMVSHLLTWGNFYAEIEWSRAGFPRALWPLRPDRMTPKRDASGALVYDYRINADSAEETRFSATQIYHRRGLGSNGIVGHSPIRLHMEAIGLGLATQEFGSRFFGAGANLGGILEHPGHLGEDAHRRLKNSFSSEHVGLSNAHRVKILEEGMKFTSVGIPPEEAQFLETRKFQLNEIARIFRVQPHMIGDLERSTNNNIEHQSLEFVIHTLRPYLVRDEQAISQQLMTSAESRLLFAEYLVDGLLRGDIVSRYEAYSTGINAGILTRNEARIRENLNPLDGLDEPLVPLNMVAAGDLPPPPPEPPDEERSRPLYSTRAAGDRVALALAQLGLIEDVAARVVRREVNDIGRAITKFIVNGNNPAGFLLWLSTFYDEHQDFVERQMLPPFRTIAALVLSQVARELDDETLVKTAAAPLRQFAGEYVGALAVRWVLSNRGQLETLMRDAQPTAEVTLADILQARLDGWAETEAGKVAQRESVRSVNASAKAAYRAGGVTRLRWVASGENCPFCRRLNGKIVGIEENFAEAGEFDAPGADAPLRVRRAVGHPPIHQGCDCSIVAA